MSSIRELLWRRIVTEPGVTTDTLVKDYSHPPEVPEVGVFRYLEQLECTDMVQRHRDQEGTDTWHPSTRTLKKLEELAVAEELELKEKVAKLPRWARAIVRWLEGKNSKQAKGQGKG